MSGLSPRLFQKVQSAYQQTGDFGRMNTCLAALAPPRNGARRAAFWLKEQQMELSSKASVIWVLLSVAIIVAAVLVFVYLLGDIYHAVPQ